VLTLRVIVAICVITLLAACGSGPQPRKATYQVDGAAGAAALVRYRIPGGEEKQEQVILPWQTEVQYGRGQQLEVVADNTSRAANITCSITIEGQTVPSSIAEDVDQAVCKLP
jgi:uncharacterized phage protein gp47/JayE